MFSCLRVAIFIFFVTAFLMVTSIFASTAVKIGSGSKGDPIQITTCQQLQDMNPGNNYVLASNIDCSDTVNWNNGAGFIPIDNFSGTLDGANFTIEDIYMNSQGKKYIGIFTGLGNGATVKNLKVENESIKGSAEQTAGGIVGWLMGGGVVDHCYVQANIDLPTTPTVGGVVGLSNGSISNVVFEGNITGQNDTGGIVGLNRGGCSIQNSYANVHANSANSNSYVGGLVGENYGIVNGCYSEGDISAPYMAGGLIAWSRDGATVSHSYSMANVAATGVVPGTPNPPIGGGLLGGNNGAVSNCYSVGKVESAGNIGGLSGKPGGTFTNDYYDMNTSGQKDTGRGNPTSTANMFKQATFSGWDFTNNWKITESHDYPRLQWQSISFNIEVLPISSPQRINQPFPVTINANNTSFNGRVDLTSDRGDVTPTYVNLVNGTWSGNVAIDYIGKRNRLLMRWSPQYSYDTGLSSSNTFDVQDASGDIKSDSQLTGVVTNDNGSPLSDVSVKLYAVDPSVDDMPLQPLYTTTTDATGAFTVSSAVTGAYYAVYSLSGYQNKIVKTQLISAGEVHVLVNMYAVCGSGGKVPVLLVPGIMGSTASSQLLPGYPVLPKSPSSSNLSILDPFGKVGWKGLEGVLYQQGYRLNCTMFEVPYDWSQPIQVIDKNYLQKAIIEADAKSDSHQVDIVAHSMGGLAARAYVQLPDYPHNVRKLALLGTPNEGATVPYYIWEGGDPIKADTVSGSTSGWYGSYFYSNTIELFMNSRGWGNACDFKGNAYDVTPTTCNEAKIYNFMNAAGKGLAVGALMPIYGNAIQDVTTGTSLPINAEENQFLKALNHVSCLHGACVDRYGKPYNYVPPAAVYTADNTGVQTKLFYGRGINTAQTINVGRGGQVLYKDGVPTEGHVPIINTGDDTVLTTSIKSQYLPADLSTDPTNSSSATHRYLPGYFKTDIASFLTGKKLKPIKEVHDATSAMFFSVNGRVMPSVQVTNQLGQPVIFKNSQETDQLGMDYSGIELSNPAKGSYKLSMKAPYTDGFDFSISYADSSNADKVTTYHFIDTMPDNGALDYTFNFDPAATPMISLGRNLQPPQDIALQNNQGNIEVTWTDPVGDADKDVDHYEVYVKSDISPIFVDLGSEKDKYFTTGDEWVNVAKYTYAVKAVLSNGSSTVFSGLSFYDSSSG